MPRPSRDISVPETSISTTAKPYTVYHIRISTPNSLRPQVLLKRYSDFTAMHALFNTQVGAYPPSALPAKSWFSRTVNNAPLTEDRRRGLETYLRAIEDASDARWRNAPCYRDFLELDDPRKSNGSAAAARPDEIRTASAWLDAHTELKSKLQEARLGLSRREQLGTVAAQHEAAAAAKRSLLQVGGIIRNLEAGLDRMSGKAGADEDVERLGEGEIRRRRDMVSTAKKEREGLEGVLASAAAVKSPTTTFASSATSPRVGSRSAATFSSMAAQSSRDTTGSGPNFTTQHTSGRRVLGGPPPQETSRTRELDNEGVLQLQKQIIREQDTEVIDLTKAVRRMRELGLQIHDEVEAQNELLEVMDQDVERVDAKIQIGRKRMAKIK